METAPVFAPDLWRVPERTSLLPVQQQRLSIQVVLQGERGAVPQAQVRVLHQLRAEQASEAEHLVDLRPGLDGARPFDPHVVDSLAGAETERVYQVTGNQNGWQGNTHNSHLECTRAFIWNYRRGHGTCPAQTSMAVDGHSPFFHCKGQNFHSINDANEGRHSIIWHPKVVKIYWKYTNMQTQTLDILIFPYQVAQVILIK